MQAIYPRQEVLRLSKKFYSRRARYYDLFARVEPDDETRTQLDFIEGAFRKHAGHKVGTILDVACGGGRHVVGLAQRGYACVGYDISRERIKVAKELAARASVSVEVRQGEATQVHDDRRYDAALAISILFLLPSDEDIVATLKRVYESLGPGGVLICNIFNPFSKGRHWILKTVEDGPHVREKRAPGAKLVAISKAKDFDQIQGVVWLQETTLIKARDGFHSFKDLERVRLLTYWDMLHYLRKAGFKEITHYPDWNLNPRGSEAEEIVFVSRK